MSHMILYPAIDLLGGRCVRLRQGDYAQVSVFGEDPVAVARRWQAAGATWLHVVDLDGARQGQPTQLKSIAAIAAATGLPLQVGGGLRSEEDVAAAFAAGAARVILGTAAARAETVLHACLARWGERVAVSVDARGDAVTVAGWLESTTDTAADFASRMAHAGVRTLIMTDVRRDGTLAGSDSSGLLTLRAALPAVALPAVALIAAGGIATLDDIRRLARAGLDGAVLGRALYEGMLDLGAALRIAAQETATPASAAPAATPNEAAARAETARDEGGVGRDARQAHHPVPGY